MALSEAVGRIGATVLAMARTRLELATVELQEETQRLFGYLGLALVAAVLGAGALVLAVLFILVLFWDSHRLLAVGGMTALFALGCWIAVARLRGALAARPPMLAATLAELRKDVEFAKGEPVDVE
jgi:uncharacterized membrane protein YqjE